MVTAEDSGFWPPSTEPAYEDPTLDEVVKAYSVFLEVREPKQHKLFEKRLRDNRDAASSEAAIFSWLRAEKLAPRINEEPGKVGADFHCSPATGTPFLLEVTSLNAVSVANQSTWPDRSELDEIAGHFKMVTPQLSVKAIDKARQLSSGQARIPGVLAICLVHPGASALLQRVSKMVAVSGLRSLRG